MSTRWDELVAVVVAELDADRRGLPSELRHGPTACAERDLMRLVQSVGTVALAWRGRDDRASACERRRESSAATLAVIDELELHALAKVELHLHLDSSMSLRAVTMLDPTIDRAQYEHEFKAPPKCLDLADFLRRPPRIIALMQDRRGLEVAVADVLEQLAADNVIYAELRFAPMQHVDGGLSPREVLEVVDRAVARHSVSSGVTASTVVCTLRHYDRVQSTSSAALAAAFVGSTVRGFDIAADEAGFPLHSHVEAFEVAAEAGLGLTAHAGEALGPSSVRETLRRLRPTRIGHGVRCVEDTALVTELARSRVHLEVCPTSNVQTDVVATFGDHPVDTLCQAGVSLSLSTDSRTVNDTTLTSEYRRVAETFGWDAEQFARTNREALGASFIDRNEQNRLMSRLTTQASTST